MAVDITGRHIEITPAIRKYTLEKLRKLSKYLDDIIETHVVLSVEKHRHFAEMVVHSRTARLSSHGETEDLYSAISLVVDKLERQAHKHKEKMKNGSKKKGTASIRTALKPLPADEESPAPRPRDSARSSSAASAALRSAPSRSADAPRIIRTSRYRVKPMTPEEAALEVDGSRDAFLVFRNSTSQRVSVVYRRPDGNFGLIEP